MAGQRKGVAMKTFISLVDYTAKGIGAIKESPTRLRMVKRLAKQLGGKVKDFYLTIGDHDLVVVYEMPDDETAAKFLLTVGSVGAIRTKTLTALSEKQYREVIAGLS